MKSGKLPRRQCGRQRVSQKKISIIGSASEAISRGAINHHQRAKRGSSESRASNEARRRGGHLAEALASRRQQSGKS